MNVFKSSTIREKMNQLKGKQPIMPSKVFNEQISKKQLIYSDNKRVSLETAIN